MDKVRARILASAWIALQGAVEGSDVQRDSQWSASALNIACIEDPEQAWSFVVDIFESSSDPWVHENLGAGPLETLLSLHGELTLAALRAYVPDKREFLSVVAHVWSHALAPEVAKRLAGIGASD